ncbi:MAG: hypothetical protein KDI15_07635 [Thiothrix sp.]|nr:hypothetical protein [Thiothrix sp.]HPE62406.1 hypothetical protein [Thiolinea sp.]
MATTKTNASARTDETADTELRQELDALRDLVSELLDEFRGEKEGPSRQVDQLKAKLEKYQNQAEQKLHDAYNSGSTHLDDVGGLIRRNPLASLAVAFGAGYLLSRILGGGKDRS